MAVAVGNTSSASGNTASLAWVHTLGTGSDLVLICSVGAGDGASINSVTWDVDGVNESLSLVRSLNNPGLGRAALYFLLNPSAATGSSEITVVYATKNRGAAGAITFTGATTPDNDDGSQAETGTVRSESVVAGADDYIVDSMMVQDGTGLAVGETGQIQNYSLAMGTGGSPPRGAASYRDGVEGNNMSWTWDNSGQAVIVACRIPAASVSGPPPYPFKQRLFQRAHITR